MITDDDGRDCTWMPDEVARSEETPGSAAWRRKHANVLARTPTLGEAAGDPLEGVPLRGLFWLSWAATKAGLRDAWRRLMNRRVAGRWLS